MFSSKGAPFLAAAQAYSPSTRPTHTLALAVLALAASLGGCETAPSGVGLAADAAVQDAAEWPNPSAPSAPTEEFLASDPAPADWGTVAARAPAGPPAPAERDVIVNLRLDLADEADDDERRDAIVRARALLPARLPVGSQIRRTYDLVPAVAMRIPDVALADLANTPGIASVQPDEPVHATLAFAGPMVGAPAAHKLGQLGKGVRVAVIDTGVDAQHPDLAGRVVAQHCFALGGCPPYGATESALATDDQGHGTHVAGIVLGAGKTATVGIAPAAELVAVKVLGKDGTGATSDILAALNWVAAKAKTLKIRVVNLSLGSQQAWSGPCDKADPATAAAVKLLAKRGVAVFAAAGNEGMTNGLGNPACLTQVHAVGAVYAHDLPGATYPGLCADKKPKAGQVACFSNRSKSLHLVAPGAPIVSLAVGGGTASMSGTSQASPVAAGVAALMLGCNPQLSAASVGSILNATGKPLADPVTGLTLRLVQAVHAVQGACGK